MQLSVVEGFYGRPWPDEARLALLPIMSSLGYSSYVYAPKSESLLRRKWGEPYGDDALARLNKQREAASACGTRWGLGFSPLGLDELDAKTQSQLSLKLLQLAELNPDSFCVLFDDMRGDKKYLAKTQLAIVDLVASILGDAAEITVCPTYYTTDSILETLFGQRPKNYWEDIGAGLDPKIKVFWTGEKVCSESYSKFNLEFISEALQRAPSLWDNYPVNDSKRLASRLLLKPFENREPWLRDYLSAHHVNPMNEAWLSLLPLSTLPPVYDERHDDLKQAQSRVWRETLESFGEDIANIIPVDVERFHSNGLTGMSTAEQAGFLEKYSKRKSAMAQEVYAWLNGYYAFDEACLTD